MRSNILSESSNNHSRDESKYRTEVRFVQFYLLFVEDESRREGKHTDKVCKTEKNNS